MSQDFVFAESPLKPKHTTQRWTLQSAPPPSPRNPLVVPSAPLTHHYENITFIPKPSLAKSSITSPSASLISAHTPIGAAGCFTATYPTALASLNPMSPGTPHAMSQAASPQSYHHTTPYNGGQISAARPIRVRLDSYSYSLPQPPPLAIDHHQQDRPPPTEHGGGGGELGCGDRGGGGGGGGGGGVTPSCSGPQSVSLWPKITPTACEVSREEQILDDPFPSKLSDEKYEPQDELLALCSNPLGTTTEAGYAGDNGGYPGGNGGTRDVDLSTLMSTTTVAPSSVAPEPTSDDAATESSSLGAKSLPSEPSVNHSGFFGSKLAGDKRKVLENLDLGLDLALLLRLRPEFYTALQIHSDDTIDNLVARAQAFLTHHKCPPTLLAGVLKKTLIMLNRMEDLISNKMLGQVLIASRDPEEAPRIVRYSVVDVGALY